MEKKDLEIVRYFIWNFCRQQEKINYSEIVELAYPDMSPEQRREIVLEMKNRVKGVK